MCITAAEATPDLRDVNLLGKYEEVSAGRKKAEQ